MVHANIPTTSALKHRSLFRFTRNGVTVKGTLTDVNEIEYYVQSRLAICCSFAAVVCVLLWRIKVSNLVRFSPQYARVGHRPRATAAVDAAAGVKKLRRRAGREEKGWLLYFRKSVCYHKTCLLPCAVFGSGPRRSIAIKIREGLLQETDEGSSDVSWQFHDWQRNLHIWRLQCRRHWPCVANKTPF